MGALKRTETLTLSANNSSTSFSIGASIDAIDLSRFCGYSHVVIHVKNSGALTTASGSFTINVGLLDSTVSLPASPVKVAGDLPALSSASAYDNLVIIKGGFFEKLSLAYTRTGGSGTINIRVAGVNID